MNVAVVQNSVPMQAWAVPHPVEAGQDDASGLRFVR
jgi:hypothetical protein